MCESYIKLNNMKLGDIKYNKSFDFSKVRTIDVIKGYYLSYAPNKEIVIKIMDM